MFRVVEEHGRDALGAEVTMTVGSRTIRRDVRAASSYLASNDPRVHIGLGPETTVRERDVRWPDGIHETFGDMPADRIGVLRRGGGRPIISYSGSTICSVRLTPVMRVSTWLRPEGQSTSMRSIRLGVAEPEVQRQRALREVARLAVVLLGVDASAGAHAHGRAEPVAVRRGAGEHHLEPVNRAALREVADQHLRRRIEVVGDDVEVAVVVEIEHRRRAAAERRHHHDLSRLPAAEIGAESFLQAVELEPRRVRPAAAARLDAEQELGVAGTSRRGRSAASS